MHRLSSLDSFFLAAEDGRTNLNVAALAIVDPVRPRRSRLNRDDIVTLVSERIHLLPPLRWRLVEVPLGIGHPYWIDSEVDLDYHIREIALPAPGDQYQLQEQVARVANHPMDRAHPLWEIYLIQGLREVEGLDGEFAGILTKFHHSVIDGESGEEIMSILFDASPKGRKLAPAPPSRVDPKPSDLNLLMRGVAEAATQPMRVGAAGIRTLAYLDQVPLVRGIVGARQVGQAVRRVVHLAQPSIPDPAILNTPEAVAPRTPFNGTVTRRRRFSMLSVPFDKILEVKRAHDATVNDVVVALSTGAVRTWLIEQDQLPADPLVAVIPVAVRTQSAKNGFGNAVNAMLVPIPTNESDPQRRMLLCRNEMREAKEIYHATPANLLQDSTDMVPPALFSTATRAITGLASTKGLEPIANVIISNVPGSRSPLYCDGAPILQHYPVSTIADSLGLNITVFSYLNQLNFGLVADYKLVPDLDGLAEALRDELDLLLDTQPASEGDY